MKVLTFTYTKPDGSVSDRTLMALVTPGDKFAGIDLSNIDPSMGAEFFSRYKDLYADFMAEVKELQAEFDLKHNYRQFDAARMTNVIEI